MNMYVWYSCAYISICDCVYARGAYMCVCVCVCVRVRDKRKHYIHTHYTHTCVFVSVCMHGVCIHMCVYVFECMYIQNVYIFIPHK
jgi:hypothetical protein